MTKGFSKNGKFYPIDDSQQSGVSSEVVTDNSENEVIKTSDVKKLKEQKS